MSFASKLAVPLVKQENDYSCVPACLKMILEYVLQTNSGSYQPNLSVDKICEIVKTDELGTALENVELINQKLINTFPSVEFVVDTCSFSVLEQEIIGGQPVIVGLKMPYPHAVVVSGLDKENLIVYYNDPLKDSEKKMEMGKFLSAWNEQNNVAIKVKIGEKIQRIIPEYSEGNENGVGQG